MPSANKTPLGLNQWQANEYPKMADFNEDNRIIDQKLTELQSGSGVKIYTVEELTDPAEGKIYNVKITKNTSTINGKPVYKENTSESVTLKAGKVATVYFSGGNFFYKANASGDAIAEHVLAGKTFSNDDDTDVVGDMPNHGAKIFKPSTANIIIPKGFHNGTGYIEGDPDLVAGNIVQGKQIFGVDGQALQYQQSEKTAIANAVTSKGVPTSTNASWGQIEQNIRKIKSSLKNGLLGVKALLVDKNEYRTGGYYENYSWHVRACYSVNTDFPIGTLIYAPETSNFRVDRVVNVTQYGTEYISQGIQEFDMQFRNKRETYDIFKVVSQNQKLYIRFSDYNNDREIKASSSIDYSISYYGLI